MFYFVDKSLSTSTVRTGVLLSINQELNQVYPSSVRIYVHIYRTVEI